MTLTFDLESDQYPKILIPTHPNGLFRIDLTGKTVLIIGPAGSGKTTLAHKLSELWPEHRLIGGFGGMDSYMETYTYEGALYAMLQDVHYYESIGNGLIGEGVQGPRLLRKGVEGHEGIHFYPDIVIELEVSEEQIRKVYADQRPGKNVAQALSQAKGLKTTLESYKKMNNPKPPVWITIQNNF